MIGVYTNKPDVHLRGVRSEIHHGALVFDTHGSQNHPASLTGEYWTDRRTTGSMVLEERVEDLYTRHVDALTAFAAASG